ncbi:sensor histidine kinase [Streptomyces sp. NPDC021020]|uniref:sensor histidine kinase n=1 Tax=Streptomyces sp. NPDC021020 TaxID=3365109 RepID=UPI0037A8CBC0
MTPWLRPAGQLRVWSLHRWYVLGWLLLGLLPLVLAGRDDPAPARWAAMGLPVAVGAYYLLTLALPGRAVSRPRTVVWVLIAGLGGMAYLREGGASVYVATLPHFWYLAGAPGPAVSASGIAAAVTVLGGDAPQGLSPHVFTGNAVATLAAFAVSVAAGLAAVRLIEQNDERVRQLNAELEGARLRLVEAYQQQGATEERERLAREIHDTLAQGFASIVALAEAARSGIADEPARSAQQLRSIERTARENLAEARALVRAAPTGGDGQGPVTATLLRVLERFAEDTGLATDAELAEVECDQQTRIALLRCTQESLANVRKHAAASAVGLVLTAYGDRVELEITDDGRGFAVGTSQGFGLDGMRRRMAELGGELKVTSSVGDGTRVLAVIPTARKGEQ